MLLCGDSRNWDSFELARLQERYPQVLTVHHFGAPGSGGSFVDEKGKAFEGLGVRGIAQYLVRPDGYIAFRSSGRRFDQLDQYLAAWYVPAK